MKDRSQNQTLAGKSKGQGMVLFGHVAALGRFR